MKRIVVALSLLGALSLWTACGTDSRAGFEECKAPQSRSCDCPNGAKALQECTDDGSFGACACDGATPSFAQEAGPRGCGDGVCEGLETCRSCGVDCGACEKCAYAPACEGAEGVPTQVSVRTDLVQPPPRGEISPPEPAPDGACYDAELRVRIQKIKVYRGSGDAYCIIEANDGKESEVAITMKTGELKDNQEFFFPVGQGVLWGQKELKTTTNNLTLTYNCYNAVDNSAWAAALKALGDTAASVGGSAVGGASPYGWAFGLGGAAANAASAAITAAQKDQRRIQFQQTIGREQLLDLTNGRSWTIMREDDGGTFGWGNWKWEITIQSWGCSAAVPQVR